jgi:general stress protein 13/S1 RNA binding domain protein
MTPDPTSPALTCRTIPHWRLPLGTAGQPAPKVHHIAEIEVGAVIDGTVERITPYGAFLKLEDAGSASSTSPRSPELRQGRHGTSARRRRPGEVRRSGTEVDLSIKACGPRAGRRRGSDPGFEQMLKKFMKSSEENLVDYKRAVEHKRK